MKFSQGTLWASGALPSLLQVVSYAGGTQKRRVSHHLPVSPVPPFDLRPLDISGQGYKNWIFMSTHYWDEDPQGLWTLGLENKGYYFNTGERVGCCQAVPAGLCLPGCVCQAGDSVLVDLQVQVPQPRGFLGETM